MGNRISSLIAMACFSIAAFGLYLVKYTVQDVQRDVTTLEADLGHERESLHLLNAEWAYLNRPERLRELADRHLDLSPLDSRQFQNVGVLPAAYDDVTGDDATLIHAVAQ